MKMSGVDTAAVACEGLTKTFDSTVALADVDLSVAPGEILALLGPSGCGKTTFLRVVAGFERPDAGRVVLAGRTVAGDGAFVPPERRRAGFVFQDYALFPHMTVGGNVAYGLLGREDRAARVAETLDLVGLTGFDARHPHELSGGQQQRVALARALAPGPAIVLLDEPFSNLDADLRARVRTEVRDILQAAGTTAVFVTHDQEEAFEIADRVAVMREGRIEQVGRPEEIYHIPQTRFVADFVGQAEFLPAEVRGHHLTTELGTFEFEEAAAEPGPGEIMLRPEDIELASQEMAATSGEGMATGRAPGPGPTGEIVARRFQGPVNLSVVRLPSGRTVTSAHSSQTLFHAGDHVRVRFAPDHLVFFRGEQRAAWIPAREHTGTDPEPV